jgi:hypothetical protein
MRETAMMDAAKTDSVCSNVTKDCRPSSSVASGARFVELRIDSLQLGQFEAYIIFGEKI